VIKFMSLTHPINLIYEAQEHSLPETYRDFIEMAGQKNISKRMRWLSERIEQPHLRDHITFKYPIERALLTAITHMNRYRYLPPTRTNPTIYRLFSFLYLLVLVHKQLSDQGKRLLAGRIVDGLKSEFGLSPLESELSLLAHFANRGCQVECSDLEGSGQFEFLLNNKGLEIEVECKTIGIDTGRKIKRDLALRLFQLIENQVHATMNQLNQGMIAKITVPSSLPSSSGQLGSIARIVESCLRTGVDCDSPEAPCKVNLYEFKMTDSPFGADSSRGVDRNAIDQLIFEKIGQSNIESMYAFRPAKSALAVVIVSETADNDVHSWFRPAREAVMQQFTGTRPSILCVQLLGLSSLELLGLAKDDSLNPAQGNKLQLAATRILTEANRSHLHSVVIRGSFSPEFMNVNREGVSETAPAYIFYNPHNSHHDDVRCRLFSRANSL
jgi:hypothetical protein